MAGDRASPDCRAAAGRQRDGCRATQRRHRRAPRRRDTGLCLGFVRGRLDHQRGATHPVRAGRRCDAVRRARHGGLFPGRRGVPVRQLLLQVILEPGLFLALLHIAQWRLGPGAQRAIRPRGPRRRCRRLVVDGGRRRPAGSDARRDRRAQRCPLTTRRVAVEASATTAAAATTQPQPAASPTVRAIVIPPGGTPATRVVAPETDTKGTSWPIFAGMAAAAIVAGGLVIVRRRKPRGP